VADFLTALRSGRVLLMDGAMGTELRRAGLPDDGCGEAYNLTHPERVRAVHQAYADAGAEVLLTNTFQANGPTLARHGLPVHLLTDYYRAAQNILKPFNAHGRFSLVSIGPIVEATGGEEFADLHLLSKVVESGSALDLEAGPFSGPFPASGLLLETCSSPRVRLAVRRAKQPAMPVLLSLTYRKDAGGKLVTQSGHPPEWFAERAAGWEVRALGVNCGRDIGMDETIEIVRRYRAVTDLPLFARPNAGTPTRKGKRWAYPHTPEAMAARLPELLEAGVSMVGGCCGTTPEHIAAFRPVVEKWNRRRRSGFPS
jgi:5-methyltetrahydrofolate--homocysteine methyltransferase